MLSVWALRARSYKTMAEAWVPGHRSPSSPRGLSGFCLAPSKGVPKFKSSKVQCSVLSVLSVVEKSEYPAAYRTSGSRVLAHL